MGIHNKEIIKEIFKSMIFHPFFLSIYATVGVFLLAVIYENTKSLIDFDYVEIYHYIIFLIPFYLYLTCIGLFFLCLIGLGCVSVYKSMLTKEGREELFMPIKFWLTVIGILGIFIVGALVIFGGGYYLLTSASITTLLVIIILILLFK